MAKEELSRECDYELEATNQKRFRELLSKTEGFYVPMVIDDISSRRVLTTEFVSGNCFNIGLLLYFFPLMVTNIQKRLEDAKKLYRLLYRKGTL